jgi:hypothetical protein
MSRLPWRAALYLAVVGYLVLDLKVFQGPLHDAMRTRRDAAVAEARARGYVALVNLEPVTRARVDLAVARHLRQRGKTVAEIPGKNLDMIRRAVLQSLVDEILVNQHADGEKFTAPAAETEAFIAAWKSAFASPEELARRAAAAGLDPATLDEELARLWSRKRWLEKRIKPGVTVSEEEARTWFEQNRGDAGKPDGLLPGFHEPEKARIRFAMLGAGEEALVRGLHAKLKSGERTFGDVAREHSLDTATKENGGEPGWVAREALPDSLVAAVFAGENGLLEPVRGDSAWYLVEVLERRARRPFSFEQLRGEIIAHLEAQRTAQVVRIQMDKLRKVANLQIFPENL